MDPFADLLHHQHGVLSRAQALRGGLQEHDLRRRIRRREWAVVHPGVYVEHTGPLTTHQQHWAAVLAMAPAALSHASALAVAAGTAPPAVIHVMVDRDRVVAAPRGVVRHRVADFEGKVLTSSSPPRQRLEEAVLDVAAESVRDLDAVAVLCEVVGTRRTTPARVRTALDARSRLARRALLEQVLDDLEAGACSALEQGYLQRVERAHGLPAAGRQVRASGRGRVYRDVEYRPWGLVVELDGRAFHTSVRDRARDLDRDLAAAVTGRDTVRLGWGQVYAGSCATATAIGTLLRRRGWPGEPTACADCGR
ncbi:hypothetical protein GHK92_00025 [Nocardioides sp. dk4132]|uniref:hypothetical protein n=1 Tax=unclassified Nocardioides TaxID=2615069 RepID=UPI0012973B62|nr:MULTISPECIES: hypothetical protein [unclassified Nocardioides]MQW74250.1 hypothetical protein [Nocardioides sp. dk4132]QGA06209.1 hypothetical protein GFH29_01480 [Nocardioides sp. dk884]